ncbi:MAG: hypothetical protein WBF17_25760, partial [Phycisphaerae bacterium]
MSQTPEDDLGERGMRHPVRTAWIAGAETFDRFGRVLQPLAIGLIDETVDVVIFSPAAADDGELASAPYEVVRYRPPRWWRPRKGMVAALAADLRNRKVELLYGLDGSVAGLTHALARAVGVGYLLGCYSRAEARRIGESARPA